MQEEKWQYGKVYKNYDMNGIIDLPNESKIKVCDLTVEMPSFMKDADTIFIDPPCSKGNLRSFYTKADKELEYVYEKFNTLLFQRIQEINPKYLFIEVFKSNKELFIEKCKEVYTSVVVYDSFYYNSRSKKCWIIHCTNETENQCYSELNDIDEEKVIKWICENHTYYCIGDLCMGRGLVGKYAYLNNKKFVGTELNKKRLAILIDTIQKLEEKKL